MSALILYIIAGCNGAGKTTASMLVLPEVLKCREFVNADEIAKGLSLFNPEEVAIEAGRLMLQRIEILLNKRDSFAIEATLATKYIEILDYALKKEDIGLYFFISGFLLQKWQKNAWQPVCHPADTAFQKM